MNITFAKSTVAPTESRRIRVMVVDDAIVVRGLFARWVDAEPDLQMVATLRSGREAVDQIERHDPDVVVLDVEMPDLDGLSALPLLFQKKRDVIVIMASTLTRRNAEISLKALSLGATDYVAKPQPGEGPVSAASTFRRELIEKIRQLGQRAKRFQKPAPMPPPARVPLPAAARLPRLPTAPPLAPSAPPRHVLRAFPRCAPRVLAIGCSTGGPQALTGLMRQIGNLIDRAPVLITQHMPPTFTTILAEHLARVSGRPAREAQHGEEINAGTIYLAPGAKHMTVARRDGIAVIQIDDGPPVNFCKPAVDPLFSSAASVWGQWLLGLVLTGMGADGLRGSHAIAGAGGAVITQDEASSVVWGMPGQVTMAGISSAVVPLDDIPAKLMRLFTGGSHMTPQDYDYIRKLLRERSGLVLSAEKQYLVESRLLPVVRKSGLASLGELVTKLKAVPHSPLSATVVEAMTTNESFFFRDKLPFENFRDVIMPVLLQNRAADRHLRIWCAAAATGQEPYSLAMALKEMGAKVAGWNIEIFATDISTATLEKAKAGLYSQFEVQRGLPIQLLVKYFAQVGDQWQIEPELRAMVTYRHFNLLHDFAAFGQFDIVFCRNVLIYFDQETKITVLNRLARTMRSDGYLMLGAAETVVGLTTAFKPAPDHRGIYLPNPAPAKVLQFAAAS